MRDHLLRELAVRPPSVYGGVQAPEDLEVWRLGMDLAHRVYDVATRLPREERFGLTQQLRRAVLSVPTNICEGMGRRSNREFRRFLFIALGSLEEARTLLVFAHQRGWIDRSELEGLASRMILLRRKLIRFTQTLTQLVTRDP